VHSSFTSSYLEVWSPNQVRIYMGGSRYRFTKGLPQNLNLRTNLKLEYYIIGTITR